MAFNFTKEDIKRSQTCPPGMYIATLSEVADQRENDKGTLIEEATFETREGYGLKYFFNNKMASSVVEFIQAADDTKLDMENLEDMEINLRDYVGRRVVIAVEHNKQNGKTFANISNFFPESKIGF